MLDISEVPRGKQCGCICPSCKTPLIARQGEKKEWHFAHASRAVFEATKKECEFSFYVSVRMMARQILDQELKISLPEYMGVVEGNVFGETISEHFLVAKRQIIKITNIQLESQFEGVLVDLIGELGGFKFVVYFTHPNREVPVGLYSLARIDCGIISVSLDEIGRLFKNMKGENKSYQGVLSRFLADDIPSKSWVFHPRYQQKKTEAEKILKNKLYSIENDNRITKKTRSAHREQELFNGCGNSSTDKDTHSLKPKTIDARPAQYECIMCHTIWSGFEPGLNECPKCGTHLYSRRVKYLENTT